MKRLILTFALLLFYGKIQAQNFEWAAVIGKNYVDRALSVLVDNQGNTYVGGHYNDTVDFDPGPGSFYAINTPHSLGGGEAYILKLDAADKFNKVLTFGYPTRYIASGNMIKDASGNLYVSGFFDNTADFDPDTSQHLVTANGSSDAFLMKLDASDKFLWVKHWAYNVKADYYNTMEEGPAMTMDGSGNFYFAGFFKQTVDFDPGQNVFNLTANGEEGYILKLDAEGEFLWAKRLAKDSILDRIYPRTISADPDGNIYVAGYFQGTVDFNPDTVAVNKLTSHAQMGFILKLDANGNFLWVKQIGGIDELSGSYNQANAVRTDGAGNVYVAGGFMGTADFGSSSLVSAGFSDIFVTKLNAAGNYQWAKRMGSTWDGDVASRMALDASGNLYVTGTFRGTVDFDPGPGVSMVSSNGNIDVFVLKLTANGGFVWAKGFGGTNHAERIYGLALKNNSIYTVGKFTGQINCHPDQNYYLTSYYSGSGARWPDGFIHKMNQNTTGIREAGALGAAIFPNPAKGRFTVDLNGTGVNMATVSLFDMQGRKVSENVITGITAHVPVVGLHAGIYLVKVQSGESYTVRKLVIE